MAKLEGSERVKRRLAALPGRVRENVRAALETSADELVALQRQLVAVEEGALRSSIRKEDGRHSLSINIRAGDSDAFHAGFVEWGTVNTPAQPFFFSPYRASRTRIRSRTGRAFRKGIKESG